MAPLLVVLPFGPFLAWKRGDLVAVTQRLAGAAGLAMLRADPRLRADRRARSRWRRSACCSASGWRSARSPNWSTAAGSAASRSATACAGWSACRAPPGRRRSRISAWASRCIGIVAATAWQTELVTTHASRARRAELAGYTRRLRRLRARSQGPNYVADDGQLHRHRARWRRRAQPVAERRVYRASGMPTTEAAIETYGFSQLYLQLGEADADGTPCRARLVQALHDADLARRVLMALAGLPVADRPPAARRRAAAGAAAAAGAGRMRRLLALAAAAAGWRCRRLRSTPTRCWPIRRWKRGPAAISAELRCLVCQNQSIDDSDADLAARSARHGARAAGRRRQRRGRCVQFLVDRYGEFVLLKPVIAPHTMLLWIAAPLLLLIGGSRRSCGGSRGCATSCAWTAGARRSAEGRRAAAEVAADRRLRVRRTGAAWLVPVGR